jgi:protoheme IX farnesyltransferase
MSLAHTLPEPRVTTVGDFFALLKPRVMSLVVFTGLAGIVVAPGHLHPLTAFTALLCIAVAAGASGCLNMAYDHDIDRLMTRTATRPIPLGHVAREDALAFGWALSVAAVATMWLFVNELAAALLAFTVFEYVVVYTLWLKRRTPQNIVIGGLSGAMPAAIGWAAVTGSLSIAPLLLVAIVFMWTDAAGGQGQAAYPPADPALHGGAGAARPDAGADRHGRLALSRLRRRHWALVPEGSDCHLLREG